MAVELDTKGMNCPMPIVKAKKAIGGMSAGEEIRIESTDPGAVADFAAFCRTTGHELLDSSEADGIYVFVIRKAA